MRKILLLLTVLFATCMAKADDKVLQILLSDGQVVSINLSEEPRTTYQDGNLVITTTKNTITYPLEQVKTFTYSSVATGIDKPEKMGVAFSKDGEVLTLTGLKPHTKVTLYNVSGQLLKTIDNKDDKKVVVSASQFPFGIYVVKANGGTFKIMKR